MDERQEVKSLKKALRALTFLNFNAEATVTEVASAIGVPRATSYRLLETLAAEGYVEKQEHSNIYRLTSLVQNLSSGFGDSALLIEVAKPLVTQAGQAIRWPLALATPVGSDMMVRIITDHDTPLAIDRYCIGFRVPMLHAPAGLCYLANCDEGARAPILEAAKHLDEDGTGMRAGAADLEAYLEHVRNQGFCHIRYAQYREGGLAVPLVAGGRTVGGIVMRYVKSTFKPAQIVEKFAPILHKLAADIADAYDERVQKSPQRLNGHDMTHALVAPEGLTL